MMLYRRAFFPGFNQFYMKRQNRGLFIVLEGLDKCGKSTQAKRISEKLNAEKMNFPDRTTGLGTIISSYLKGTTEMQDEVIHLLFSANRWEMCSKIKETLYAGKSIVCDRYAYSGVAFSAAKGIPIEWCKSTDRGLPKPDLTIFLTGNQLELSKRGDFGQERYEDSSFQEKVARVFEEMIRPEGMITVDALQSIEQVEEQIIKLIEAKKDAIGELEYLWK